MLTNIPGALSGAALLALLSTARRKNSRFFHRRLHQIILLGPTSFGGLPRARVAAKRYHLDLHKRVERKLVENFVEFTRIVDIEDADVRADHFPDNCLTVRAVHRSMCALSWRSCGQVATRFK